MTKQFLVTMTKEFRIDAVILAKDEFEAAELVRDAYPASFNEGRAVPGFTESPWVVRDARTVDARE